MTAKVHDFHDGNLHFQERFGTVKLAERVAQRASERLSKEQREFIEQADMFFMATCDHQGAADMLVQRWRSGVRDCGG